MYWQWLQATFHVPSICFENHATLYFAALREELIWAGERDFEIRQTLQVKRSIKTVLNTKGDTLCAKICNRNINIYLHFVSFLHIDTTQVVEILPQIRQEPSYPT